MARDPTELNYRRPPHVQRYSDPAENLINFSLTNLVGDSSQFRCGGCNCFLNYKNGTGLCSPCRSYLFSFLYLKEEKGKIPRRVFQLLGALAKFDLELAQEWLETYVEVSRMRG